MLYAPLAALAKLKEGAKQHVDFASPSSSILYLDGEPALEKKDTHQARADIRLKALAAAANSVEHLIDLVEHGRRVRKQHFVAVEDNLRKAWAWSPTERQGLVEYLRSRHWEVVECPTEADVEIGKLCRPVS
ncbi:hypothetical protein BGZ93_002975 [Podila epicladia]|nr:hypothetical protein BGZ93_002975 [Podila epicladia]